MSNKAIVSGKFSKKKGSKIKFGEKKSYLKGNTEKKLTLLTLFYSFVDTKIAQESENVRHPQKSHGHLNVQM